MWLRRWLWRLVVRLQWVLRWRALRVFYSREYIDSLSSRTEARPRPHSLATAAPAGVTGAASMDFVSWTSLTDRAFTGRHLPSSPLASRLAPDTPERAGEPYGPFTELFRRQAGMEPSSRSSLLFAFFAQWFTDSLFRTSALDPRRNGSNHDIDLCQIYGLDVTSTRALRSLRDGKLMCRGQQGALYPDLLLEDGPGPQQQRVKERYSCLPYADDVDAKVFRSFELEREKRRPQLYAAGLDVGNSSIGYTAISTVFLREHNRLCDELLLRHPELRDDDERVFQTARNINIVLLLKILVEDYINHILGIPLFLLEPGFAEGRSWYRPNWMALEFNLLYRWHGLIPDSVSVAGRQRSPDEYRFNNALLEQVGVAEVLRAASTQPAGRIGLSNTPRFLLPAERASVQLGRRFRLDSFNEYRKKFGLRPLKSFQQLLPTRSAEARELQRLYGHIDDLEFVVGVFAEEPQQGSLFGELMTHLVAYDALTQIFSNPLLSRNVFNEGTFTALGLETIRETGSLQDLVDRNVPEKPPASLSTIAAA